MLKKIIFLIMRTNSSLADNFLYATYIQNTIYRYILVYKLLTRIFLEKLISFTVILHKLYLKICAIYFFKLKKSPYLFFEKKRNFPSIHSDI